jgi:hypothetical protein
LDFLSITDHNTIAAQPQQEKILDPGLVLIRGVESTTFKGHFNCWGIPDWIDFRVSDPEQMRSLVQYAIDRGAITSCGHPKPYGPDWEFREVNNHHCVEVWNGPWTGFNEISLDYWIDLLATGRHVTAIGGSDFHVAGERSGLIERDLGIPTNWVYVPETADSKSILQSIEKGHVSLSETPDGPFVELRGGDLSQWLQGDLAQTTGGSPFPIQVTIRGGEDAILKIIDQNGSITETAITTPLLVWKQQIDPSVSRYCRVEVRSLDNRLLAMTNPIYYQPTKE